MRDNHLGQKLLPVVTGAVFLLYGLAAEARSHGPGGGETPSSKTKFFVPPPDAAAVQQGIDLLKKHNLKGVLELAAMLAQGHAVWFTSGTPQEVQQSVRKTMKEAALEDRVPVVVAYNVPYRDCAQYSAGGAIDTAAYEAWIDGFASGIGSSKAVVILEPDSLGLIPYNTTIYGVTEGCKPTVTDAQGNETPAPGADPSNRYTQLNYAVASLKSHAPNAQVYLDGTHSAWLGVGEAAYRLNKAGVASAAGFFLNASNYQPTDQATQFGTWVSDCLTAATAGASWAAGHFDWCPSQYDPALNYALNYSPAYAATVTAGLQNMMGGAAATTHFIIDTSRNGQGTLNTDQYAAAPYGQPADVISALASGNWCNPPGAGVGLPPSANTGVALLDAYLWVKVPGESDGQCDSAGGARAWDYSLYNPWNLATAAQSTFDPLWGMVDPSAGTWFPAQALQLAQNANPPLIP